MAEIAKRALAIAKSSGASDAEVEVSAAVGQSVTVRRGEVETVEYNRDKGLGITVYFGKRRGNEYHSGGGGLGKDRAQRAVDRKIRGARRRCHDGDGENCRHGPAVHGRSSR